MMSDDNKTIERLHLSVVAAHFASSTLKRVVAVVNFLVVPQLHAGG